MDEVARSVAESSARYLLKKAALASEICGDPPDQLLPIFESLARKYSEPKWLDEDEFHNGDIPWLNPSRRLQETERLVRGGIAWTEVPAFAILVAQLVKRHGLSAAQEIIETEDLDLLEERNHLLQSLLRYERFLTTDELATRAEAFVSYLEQNRESLLATGYPTTVFTSWPQPLAVNLYPVKFPENLFDDLFTRGRSRRDPNQFEFVIDRPPLVWCCPGPDPSAETAQDRDDVTERTECPTGTIPCRYEDAPFDIDRDLEVVRRLEEGRAALFTLKVRLLSRLTSALRRGSAAGLWDDCLRSLTDALLGNEADFYLTVDSRRGPKLRRTGELAESYPAEMLPGGLTEMIELIGYCEKELTLGTMDRTKRALISVVERDTFEPYLAALGKPARALIDHSLDAFEDRLAQESAFWEEFQTRVNQALENEFEEEVIVRTRVKRLHTAKFEPGLQFLAEWSRIHLEQTGDLPSLQAVRSTPLPVNRFRQEGKLWTIAFDGREVYLKDMKGLHFLAYLLRHPNEEILVLDLVNAVEGMPVPTNNTDRRDSHIGDDIGTTLEGFGDAGPLADEQTRKSLKKRLQEIDKEIHDAEEFGNSEGAEALRQEKDNILQYLSEAYGLGGRQRVVGSEADRARTRITNAIRRALADIADVHPSLRAHLRAISMGISFSYKPLGDDPPAWEF